VHFLLETFSFLHNATPKLNSEHLSAIKLERLITSTRSREVCENSLRSLALGRARTHVKYKVSRDPFHCIISSARAQINRQIERQTVNLRTMTQTTPDIEHQRMGLSGSW
jgi:hypothetical protein